MANNKLILRNLNSPWVTPVGDITKGSVLSFDDMDNNFIYLRGEVIYTAETSGDTVTLKKINGEDLSFNIGYVEPIEPNLAPVLDNTLTTPPIAPDNEDSYIIPTGALNDWSGLTNQIAEWDDFNQEWAYYIPTSGDRTIVTTGTNAGKVYEFDGSLWTEVIVPVVNSTPFVLAGTSIDAGSNKTSRIARTGDVVVGSTNTSLTGKHVVFGSSLSSTYVTRNGYAPTNDITRTGKWYRVMSFDCNYSIYASHHYKFMLAFNGNSDGTGFVAEMDVLIKRQNNAIYLTCTIKQTVNGTELVYVVDDKNIEFLWNNTNKRVTMYFRPDLNYSSLSFTILTPRESTNRFNFLNQYTDATDLSGEVSDVFTEKYVVIGETVGHSNGGLIEKTLIVDQTNGDNTLAHQNQYSLFSVATNGLNLNQTTHSQTPFGVSLRVDDNVGNILTQESIVADLSIKSIQDSTNFTTTHISQNTTSISTQVEDSNNGVVNTSTQSIGSSQETITDINSGEYVDVFRDTTSYQIQVEDGLNQKGSRLNFTSNDISIASSIEDSDKSGQIRLEGEAIISTVDDKSGQDVSLTVSQSVKDFTLRFQDDSISLDNTVEFAKTKLILPDGYIIESSIQSDPDVITLISVGDTNAQGKGVLLFSRNDTNSTNNSVLVESNNVRIASIDSLNSQESYISVYSNAIELFNSITNSQFSIGEDILINSGSDKIYLNQLPIYADDAAADADVNFASGGLYKVTGSRAVYQKP